MNEEQRTDSISDEHCREAVNEFVGYAYVSSNGQLVIDRHESDGEHLTARSTRLAQPLHDCRIYLNDLVPKEWLGRRGKFTVSAAKSAGGLGAVVSIAFEPVD